MFCNHVILCYYRKIRQIIDTFGSNLHIELQQRGIEFSQLFRKYDHLRPALLERMPPMETARPQANGIIGMVNGEPEPEDEKSTIIEPATTTSDSVSSAVFISFSSLVRLHFITVFHFLLHFSRVNSTKELIFRFLFDFKFYSAVTCFIRLYFLF